MPAPFTKCIIYPVVVFNILDHYIRREEDNDNVIGTLFGVVNDGIIEIRNCFPVLHKEIKDKGVAIDPDHHHTISRLYGQVNKEEEVVGWYETGKGVRPIFYPVHEFYGKNTSNTPVHLVVDTDLSGGKITVNVFYSTDITFQKKHLQERFLPIPFEYMVSEQDRIAMQLLSQTCDEPTPALISSDQSLIKSLSNLSSALSTIIEYIQKVINGEELPNKEIGRFLTYTLSLFPTHDSLYDNILNQGILDAENLIHLSALMISNLLESEKIKDQ